MADANNANLQSTQVIARIFGVSTRRVEQLKTEGVIKGQGKPTKYDLLPTIQAYIKFLSDKANGREKKQTDAQLETDRLSADARIKKAKAEMAELELKELKGELHRASDVEAITTDHVMFVRSMLMAMPGKLAVDMAAISAAPEAAERIKKEVYSILDRLAGYRYDPEEYKRRVRERQGWNERQGDDD
jgi:phage terminase Nu1 subunit (DNA packaging protein)